MVEGYREWKSDSLAPWLPFRLPRTNLPSAFMTKTPTPILGSLLEVMMVSFSSACLFVSLIDGDQA